jgi:hypothetical protein
MAKWNVYGSVSVGVRMTVEADSQDEAISAAYENFPGLNGYAGNGGHDQLVGVNDSACSLDPGGAEPKFTEAEEA